MMPSFAIGEFRFEIVSHERVIVGEMVEERFVIDAFFRGQPFDWNPNDRPDYPGRPNRENWKFVGKVSQDVYASFDEFGVLLTDAQARQRERNGQSVIYQKVGTKRGADFRSNFFRSLMARVDRAQVAAESGRKIGQVTDAEMQKLQFAIPPVDLKSVSIDQAITLLRGQ